MITTCAQGNGQSKNLLVENDVTDLQALICSNDDLWRERRFVDDYKLDELIKALIYD